MALISILTPYRNAEKYIRETALSIFGQTHTNWEWILVNDHSEENELAEIADLLNDPRIKWLENKGRGIVDALCMAFEHASGEYITRMDADDVMPAFKLMEFLRVLENEKAQIVTGKVKYFSQTGLISSGYLAYENWLMRRSDLETCGGFTRLNYPEDYDLLFRWYQSGYVITGLDRVTHWWRDHDTRTSKTSADYAQKAFFSLKIDRFVSLDWDEKQQLIVNGTGHKGRLVAKQLIQKHVSFTWISHEPEKFPKGIYGHAVLGIDTIPVCERAQILNTTLIDEGELKEYYQSVISEVRFFNL